VINEKGETSQPGVFAAGDVASGPYKQMVIAAGQGAVAALSAYNYLQKISGGRQLKADWGKLKK
jgi:thioredoxin reductase